MIDPIAHDYVTHVQDRCMKSSHSHCDPLMDENPPKWNASFSSFCTYLCFFPLGNNILLCSSVGRKIYSS